MRVVVCDLGVGNVRSVVRALYAASSEADVVASRAPELIAAADAIVVPGQGSFGAFAEAMSGGVREALLAALAKGTPYLGICLGMQALFESSEEAPGAAGLGVLRGAVRKLEARPLPHMGWNAVDGLGRGEHFYFAHSYAAFPDDASCVAGRTSYGGADFTSVVARERVLGVQFHPEKSQRAGLALLTRFLSSEAPS